MNGAKSDVDQLQVADLEVDEIKRLCQKIAEDEPEDTQRLFGDLHQMATLYYTGALKQATQSFRAAQIAAAVGTAFFLGAVAAVVIIHGIGTTAWISVIAGATIQIISGLNFYMYGKATKQFALFHVCLERMGRYLMANSVCANIDDIGKRDEARLDLVKIMAHAPMLSIEGSDEQQTRAQRRTAKKLVAAKP